MRKFASLLAIFAIFAMSTSAFADGVDKTTPMEEYDGSTKISNTLTPGTNTADSTGDVFFFGTTVPKLNIGMKPTATQAYSSGYYRAQVAHNGPYTNLDSATPDKSPTNASFAIPADNINATGETPVIIAVTDSSNPMDHATVTLTAKPITFSATYSLSRGLKPIDATRGVKISTVDGTSIGIDLAGVNGSVEVDFTNLAVVSADTPDPKKIDDSGVAFIGGSIDNVEAAYDASAKTLTLTVANTGDSLKAGLKGTLTLVGTAAAPNLEGSKVVVAGIEEDTFILEIPVETVDYNVAPEAVTWPIGVSDDIVALDINMPYLAFDHISTDLAGYELLITSEDKVGTLTDTRTYESDHIVISGDKPEADHMLISLDAELLGRMGDAILASEGPYADIDQTVQFNIVGKLGRYGSFVVTFTRDGDERPSKDEGDPEDYNGGVNPNLPATKNEKASDETIAAYVSSQGLSVADGKIANGATLISDNNVPVWGTVNASTVHALPVISAEVTPNAVATIVFSGIDGASLVSGDSSGSGVRVVSVSDLNVIKAVSANDVERLATASVSTYETGTAEELDGKYMIFWQNAPVSSVSSASGDLKLYIFVADEGDYDLAQPLPGHVVDPVLLVKSTGASHSSSSSSCSMGFGLIAAAGLAAIALRKHSK